MQDIIFPKHKKDLVESLHNRSRPRASDGYSSGGGAKYYGKLIGALILVIAILWMIVSFISHANVVITPRKETVMFNDLLVASRAIPVPLDAIGFQIMTIEDTVSMDVKAASKESVTLKAKGTAVIYNTTPNAQQLVERTRLETPDGKTYRMTSPVTVPGAKVIAGKSVPGSIEVEVEAALPGNEYNIALSDFTIPGFKGSDKFTQFYARAKTEMTGGFIGERLVASDSDIAGARTELKKALSDKLANRAVAEIPSGWVMYQPGTFIDLDEETDGTAGAESDTVVVRESGRLRAIILDAENLRTYTINHKLQSVDATPYKVLGLGKMTFMISNPVQFSIDEDETFTFSLDGMATLVADIPLEPLKAELAGKPYSERANVFRKYSGIETADTELSPGFLRTFPASKEKINIIIKGD